MIGCATGYVLARDGFEVTVLERDSIAAHASGANAGNLNPLYRTPPELVGFSLAAFAEHAQVHAELIELGCAHAVFPVRRLHLGSGEDDRSDLERTAALFSSVAGFSATWFDAESIRRLEPRVASRFDRAVVTTGNLAVDSIEFSRALAAGAARFGATFRHGDALGLVTRLDRVTGVRTGADLVPCDDVVLATGPWVDAPAAWLGFDIPVRPVKGQLLLMRLPGGAPSHDITWHAAALYRRGAAEVWVGGTMEEAGFDAEPTAEARTRLLDAAAGVLPEIATATLLAHKAALRPMARGGPFAQRAPGWTNAYVVNGGGEKGVLWSVALAARVRDLLDEAGAGMRGGERPARPEAISATPLS